MGHMQNAPNSLSASGLEAQPAAPCMEALRERRPRLVANWVRPFHWVRPFMIPVPQFSHVVVSQLLIHIHRLLQHSGRLLYHHQLHVCVQACTEGDPMACHDGAWTESPQGPWPGNTCSEEQRCIFCAWVCEACRTGRTYFCGCHMTKRGVARFTRCRTYLKQVNPRSKDSFH
jgi:hypothetical protein